MSVFTEKAILNGKLLKNIKNLFMKIINNRVKLKLIEIMNKIIYRSNNNKKFIIC